MENDALDTRWINNTSRAARAGGDIMKNSISRRVPSFNDDISNYVKNGNYDPSDVVMDLGSKFTKSYYNSSRLSKSNGDPLAVNKNLVDKIVFSGYSDGADVVDAISFVDDEGASGSSRTTTSLGLALGERFVINPQPQFNKRDDVRTNPYRSKIGRIYAEKIMNNWPVALFQPGAVKYKLGFIRLMGLGFGGGGVYESYIRTGGEGIFNVLRKTVLAALDLISIPFILARGLMGMNKIVQFKPAFNLFNQYMTGLMEQVAVNMGLIQEGVTKEEGAGWNKTSTNYVGSIPRLTFVETLPGTNMNSVDYNQYIGVRCSNQIGVTESFSNSTRENPLMEKLNQNSMDSEDADKGDSGVTNGFSKFMSGLSNTGGMSGVKGLLAGVFNGVAGALKGSGFVQRKLMGLAGNFSEQALVMSGRSRITLPEIWSESQFSRTFTFSFKFHSAYGDDLSIFENVFYPFLFFITLGLPRQTGKMTYTSPFYVRVGVRSLIQIDYGIITNINVVRGSEINDWTQNGFPKTLSIDVDIKDMTPNISIPMATRSIVKGALETMFPTSGMSEYLSTIGGLSLRDQWWDARLKRALTLVPARFNNKFSSPSAIKSRIINTPFIYRFYSIFNAVDADTLNRDPRGNINIEHRMVNTAEQNAAEEKLFGQDMDVGDRYISMTSPSFTRDSTNNYGLSTIVDRSNEIATTYQSPQK